MKDLTDKIAAQMRHRVRLLPPSLQLCGLKGIFLEFDLNKNGKISRSEFRAGLRKLHVHLSDHRYRLICNMADPDKRYAGRRTFIHNSHTIMYL